MNINFKINFFRHFLTEKLFFGIFGFVIGTVAYHLIKQSKGDLKGKGFAIASNIIGALEILAVSIFYLLFAGFGS